MPIDYRLITTYKQLIDLCKDTQIVKLVNDDYMYTLNTFREYCSSYDEWHSWHSDLPREKGVLFQLILDSKSKCVKKLVDRYKQKRINVISVRKELKDHRVIWDNHEKKLTISLLKEFWKVIY